MTTSTVPATMPRGFTFRISLAYLGLYTALLASALVTVPLRVAEVDPAGKERSLALIVALGALVAVVANPLFGRLSDRTTSRFGRRRPWLVGGVLGGSAGLMLIALAPAVPAIAIGWCLAQMSFNATLSALSATVPDQVPADRRGTVSGAVGFSQLIAVPLGAASAALFGDAVIRFLVPCLAATVLVLIFAVTLPDRRVAKRLPPLTAKAFRDTFWTDPREHPTFGWMWLTRFVLFLALFTPVSYLAFYLGDRIGISPHALAGVLALLMLVEYSTSSLTSSLCGRLSDRVGRRKPFVVAAAVVMAVGMVLLATADSLTRVIVAQAVQGLATGLYFSVDVALCASVLPAPDDTAKDLGVINIANVLPQSIGPAFAPLLLAIGSGQNYTALYMFTALCALSGILVVSKVRSAR
ncbi:MFS transporter [Actinomadura macra]|uniref:MFS transporter n=1 Tax=Actinomadura macra TaxID=46164 RepID=UPI00083775C5|nr:MFS transporter [Actinomadura macra]